MVETKIKVVSNDALSIVCPFCRNWEEHPIDEQRHHLSAFHNEEWKPDEDDKNEVSHTRCLDCGKTFRLEWDYNNVELKD